LFLLLTVSFAATGKEVSYKSAMKRKGPFLHAGGKGPFPHGSFTMVD